MFKMEFLNLQEVQKFITLQRTSISGDFLAILEVDFVSPQAQEEEEKEDGDPPNRFYYRSET